MAHEDWPEADEEPEGPDKLSGAGELPEGEGVASGASRGESPVLLVVGSLMFLVLLVLSWMRPGAPAQVSAVNDLDVTIRTYMVQSLYAWQLRGHDAIASSVVTLAVQSASAWDDAAATAATPLAAGEAHVNAAALYAVANGGEAARRQLARAIEINPERSAIYRDLLGLYQPQPTPDLQPATEAVIITQPVAPLIHAHQAIAQGAAPAEVQAALRPGARAGIRAFVLMTVIGLLFVGVVLTSGILWVYYLATGRGIVNSLTKAGETPGQQPPCGVGAALMLISGTYFCSILLAMLAARWLPASAGDTVPAFMISAMALIVSAIMVPGAYLAAHGRSPWEWRVFGWRPTAQGVGYGVLAVIVLLPFVWAASVIADRLIRVFGGTNNQQEFVTAIMGMQNPWVLCFAFLLAVVVAPLVEETLFRGMLFQALDARLSLWAAASISGLLFSVIHGQLGAVLPIFVLGVAFALLTRRTGSLLAPAGAHAAFNSIAAIMAILLGWVLRGPGN